MNLSNIGMQLFVRSMGQMFEVTHICDTADEANQIMSVNHDVAHVCEDEKGRIFLAKIEREKSS